MKSKDIVSRYTLLLIAFAVMKLEIIQINLAKSKVATTELMRRDFHIALVQEPHLWRGSPTYFDRFNFAVHYSGGVGARAMILVNKKICHWPVDDLTDDDTATVAVNLDKKTIYLASIYHDILEDVCTPGFVKLWEEGNGRHVPIIAGMDTNAHSPLWGENESNSRGEDLSDFLMTEGLHVLNRGFAKTFQSTRASSIIDITVANEKALRALGDDWHVMDTVPSLSDHNYVRFSVGGYVPRKEFFRNIKKADWSKFHPEVEPVSARLLDHPTKIENFCSSLMRSISKALEEACPRKKALKRKPNKWWTPELEEARNDLLAALKSERGKDRRTFYVKTPEYEERYRRYRRLIRKAKRDSWRRFCSEAESAKDVADLVRILEGTKGQRNISLLKEGNHVAKTPQESLDILLRTHFPSSTTALDVEEALEAMPATPPATPPATVPAMLPAAVPATPPATPPAAPITSGEMPAMPLAALIANEAALEEVPSQACDLIDEAERDIVDYIDLHKTKEAIKSFGSYKAPGPDDFRPIVLKMLDDKTLLAIVEIYKAVIRTGYTPKEWRKMNVIFLAKPGKKDYSVPKAYRPITLSSFLLKGLERLIQWFIQERLISKPLPNQHAYTTRLGTETALCTFVDEVESMTLRGKRVLAVSLDCSGAFDTISFASAKQAMERLKIPPCLVRWYDGVLRGRHVKAELQGCTQSIKPGKGSPQGGGFCPR